MLSTELLAFYRQLSQQQLTIVDVETTGSFADQSRVIELSVLHASLETGIEHQQTDLINPQVVIPDNIVRFTGISQDLVDVAEAPDEVFPRYLSPLSQGVLTAHNLEFDYSFLQSEYSRLEVEFSRSPEEQLCTVQLARLMLPDLRSRSLPNLVKHFQFNVGRSHRAAADTLACWLLAERLLIELLDEDDDVLLSRFVRQWLPLKQAAQLLGCSPSEGRSRLAVAGFPGRPVGRGTGKTLMYRRGDVERLVRDSPQSQDIWL